jgi:hypothetical protein
MIARPRLELWPALLVLACAGCPEHGGVDLPVERLGTAPGVCVGLSVACDRVASSAGATCESQRGCVSEGACLYNAAFDCGTLGDATACTEAGCRWRRTCQGAPAPCDAFGIADACRPQVGCHWVEDAHVCAGWRPPCDELLTVAECDAGAGCHWEEACASGAATEACEGYTRQAPCAAQATCVWQPLGCHGTAIRCEALQTQGTCAAQRGCRWQ